MEEKGLQKKYGLATAVAMVIGIVIGSGVFFKAEKILQATGGDLGEGILSWIIGGIIMVVCAYVFATLATRHVYNDFGYLLDPHTAVAYGVYLNRRKQGLAQRHTVIMATAHPYKFPPVICDALALGQKDNPFDMLETIASCTGIYLPKALAELEMKPVRFADTIEKEEMRQAVLSFVDAIHGGTEEHRGKLTVFYFFEIKRIAGFVEKRYIIDQRLVYVFFQEFTENRVVSRSLCGGQFVLAVGGIFFK